MPRKLDSPEKIAAYKEYWRVYNIAHRADRRAHYLKHKNKYNVIRQLRSHAITLLKYKLTEADYAIMLKDQNNRCAICKTKKPGHNQKHFAVDHCHATGVVRGLLCHPCNIRLVPVLENVPLRILNKAKEYLAKC